MRGREEGGQCNRAIHEKFVTKHSFNNIDMHNKPVYMYLLKTVPLVREKRVIYRERRGERGEAREGERKRE